MGLAVSSMNSLEGTPPQEFRTCELRVPYTICDTRSVATCLIVDLNVWAHEIIKVLFAFSYRYTTTASTLALGR